MDGDGEYNKRGARRLCEASDVTRPGSESLYGARGAGGVTRCEHNDTVILGFRNQKAFQLFELSRTRVEGGREYGAVAV